MDVAKSTFNLDQRTMLKSKKSKPKRGPVRSLIAWVFMLLTGGGAGAWHFRDHVVDWLNATGVPVNTASKTPLLDLVATKGEKLVREQIDYASAGRFEVTVDHIELPRSAFRDGTVLDLRARVLKYDSDGQETMVWESRPTGRHLTVGEDPLTIGLSDQPFRVRWAPGDRLAFEVWNHRGVRPAKLFILPTPKDAPFPFKTGSPPLAVWTRNGPGDPDPVATVEFLSRRLADEPERETQRVARGRGDTGDDIEIR